MVYLSIFTILLAVLLLYNNWNTNKNTLFLALFFIVLSIYSMTHSFLITDKSVFWTAIFYNHISPLTLLPGPFLYWYTRNTIQQKQNLKKTDYLHFIPFLIQLIGITPYCLRSFAYKLEVATKITENINYVNQVPANIFFSTNENFTIRFGSFLVYVLLSLMYLWKFSFSNKQNNSSSKKTIKWLWILNISPLIIVFNSIILTYNCTTNQPSVGLAKSHYLLLISEFFFSIMTFSLLLFPNILYGITPIVIKPKKRKEETVPAIREKKTENKINTNESQEELAQRISIYLNEKQPYLNPNFSLDTISLDLRMSTNQISESLFTLFGKKFSDIKKELRVNHAINLLENNLSEFITMDAIGQKSGFTTRSNFYSTFKSITSTSPSEYLKKIETEKNILN